MGESLVLVWQCLGAQGHCSYLANHYRQISASKSSRSGAIMTFLNTVKDSGPGIGFKDYRKSREYVHSRKMNHREHEYRIFLVSSPRDYIGMTSDSDLAVSAASSWKLLRATLQSDEGPQKRGWR